MVLKTSVFTWTNSRLQRLTSK